MIRDLIRATYPQAGETPALFPWVLRLGLRFVFRPLTMARLLREVRAKRRRAAVKNDLYPLW